MLFSAENGQHKVHCRIYSLPAELAVSRTVCHCRCLSSVIHTALLISSQGPFRDIFNTFYNLFSDWSPSSIDTYSIIKIYRTTKGLKASYKLLKHTKMIKSTDVSCIPTVHNKC